LNSFRYLNKWIRLRLGEQSQSLIAAIHDRELELDAVNGSLSTSSPAPRQIDLESLRRFALSRLTDVRALLSKPDNICRARALFVERIGKIKLVPNGKGCYIARGIFDFLGGYGLRVSGAEGQS
jgi:hypothetical protein